MPRRSRNSKARERGSSSSTAAGPAASVWLIGAGPGDPDLLTVKACKVARAAPTWSSTTAWSPRRSSISRPTGARRISVAKRKSHHSYGQEDINRMLVAFALEGLCVARLKGGDPFVFGRGGEELEACRAAGVECRVVPGVTAALAAAAAAGAPLTHRGAAQAVTFVTGHAGDGADPDLDWDALARPNQTVVIYMGLSKAAAIAARLIGAGRAPATPALIVENASLPTERRLVTHPRATARGGGGPGRARAVDDRRSHGSRVLPPFLGRDRSRGNHGGGGRRGHR